MGHSGDDIERTEESRAFLKIAEQDLESARDDLEGERYHNVCYMAEQASEKAVKALLVLEGEFVAEHEVSDVLAVVGEEKGLEIDEVVENAAFLEQYANIPRYPDPENVENWNPIEDIDRSQAEEGLEKAEKVVSEIKSLLEKQCSGAKDIEESDGRDEE